MSCALIFSLDVEWLWPRQHSFIGLWDSSGSYGDFYEEDAQRQRCCDEQDNGYLSHELVSCGDETQNVHYNMWKLIEARLPGLIVASETTRAVTGLKRHMFC